MKKEVGHNFLAKLGKKRLRPGGVAATNWLIGHSGLSSNSKVLEVACNMCTTSIQLAQQYHCQITGIDMDNRALDKARSNIQAAGLEGYIQVKQGNAMKLPFADNSFDVVINEAMLTMLNQNAKEKAVAEYFRVLKPGGVLLTHDITFAKDNMADELAELRRTINVNVEPLPVSSWEGLFNAAGFHKVDHSSGRMSLMSIKGMLRDEGLAGTLRIFRNAMKKENREQFKKMYSFFNTTGKDLNYIAVCSSKQ
ncbi:class I SAM-dependent methyltransferase [Paenibacillus sp. FSL R7-0331]|uniref:class I SAM-dependent methyltransferase n=1 Tax=Paenibacillus sp. FSL R7-0331 TaxID=1536773 RepID=UPI0004F6A7CA|nr:class I SAM-dependent methyltransferase [Paenibacillus sp. FSL R7-0331]AIQ52480.1 SAM-dependent methyltransferase [Paenibacillus sp. FSL R7-0331]